MPPQATSSAPGPARERYEQIADSARSLSSQPVVQQAQAKVKDLAGKGGNMVIAKLGIAGSGDSAVDEPDVTPKARKKAVPAASGRA